MLPPADNPGRVLALSWRGGDGRQEGRLYVGRGGSQNSGHAREVGMETVEVT